MGYSRVLTCGDLVLNGGLFARFLVLSCGVFGFKLWDITFGKAYKTGLLHDFDRA